MPGSGDAGDWSWTNAALYDHHHTAALTSGNVYFDPVNKYFCAINPVPSGDAHVRYEKSGGTIADAFNSITPLNSRPHNLHTFFGENTTGLIPIASGNVMICASGVQISGQSQTVFSILQDGKVRAIYNPTASGLVTFS